MIKTTFYTYLGTNGTLTTPIHLEGIYSITKVELQAEAGKKLTRDGINFTYRITVPESQVELWYEVDE